jgi:hypothetical protein
MLSLNGNRSILKMPKYEVTRSYTVVCVATVEADTHDHAEEIACGSDDIHWKEYDNDYDYEVYVDEIEKP